MEGCLKGLGLSLWKRSNKSVNPHNDSGYQTAIREFKGYLAKAFGIEISTITESLNDRMETELAVLADAPRKFLHYGCAVQLVISNV